MDEQFISKILENYISKDVIKYIILPYLDKYKCFFRQVIYSIPNEYYYYEQWKNYYYNKFGTYDRSTIPYYCNSNPYDIYSNPDGFSRINRYEEECLRNPINKNRSEPRNLCYYPPSVIVYEGLIPSLLHGIYNSYETQKDELSRRQIKRHRFERRFLKNQMKKKNTIKYDKNLIKCGLFVKTFKNMVAQHEKTDAEKKEEFEKTYPLADRF